MLSRFRSSLVEWLSANLTEDVIDAQRAGADEDAHFEVLRAWNARLADAGWAAVSWPARFGGRDATVDEQLAYHEEMAGGGARTGERHRRLQHRTGHHGDGHR